MSTSPRGTEQYDTIVIGTGQGGKPLARALAQAGWKTAIIERDHVGGVCVNTGCTPTKTMVASGRVAHLARHAADYGVRVGPVQVDLGAVIRRKQKVVDSFRDGSRKGLERTDDLDLILGEAAFGGPKELHVQLNEGGSRTLTADRVFINTGTRTARPPIEGLQELPTLDHASIMELDSLPGHLLVLGGGYIGLEFGQMFRRFGSRVTLIHRGVQLLSREDADVAAEVAGILREDGIEVHFETTTVRAGRAADGVLELTVQGPEGERLLTGTHLLIATGRVPSTDRLNLEAAGVKTNERGFIEVNERLETTAAGIYALGDVTGGPAFTHISYDDFRILRTNLLEKGNATTRDRLVPYTVFIDPQLGHVGLHETEARKQGRNIRVARLPMTHVARAIEMGETRGFMKAVVDAETDQILGGTILGVEGGEVMSVLQVAMMGRVPYTALKEGVFAHPTLAESLNNLFMAMDA
jgi:pyruvate/2-oxoglutarate dehydrogenase complex dihydrolipoamide dehydrogenase (E3) component